MIWLMIALMTLVIFASRYLLIEPRVPIKIGPKLQELLSFSAVAVLPALIAPMIFVQGAHSQGSQLILVIANPYLLGAIIAAVLILVTKNTLLSVVLSLLAFAGLRYFL